MRLAAALASTAVFLLAFGGSASAASLECGDVVVADTALDRDLVCGGNGLVVTGGATLDLNGHALVGPGSRAAGRCFNLGTRGVVLESGVVRDGRISGFDLGVNYVDGPVRGIEDLVVSRNGVGVALEAGAGEVRGNTIVRNGTGVCAHFLAVVEENVISRNAFDGVTVTTGADGMLIQDNCISRNGEFGVYVNSSTTRILRNTANANRLSGIYVFDQYCEFFPYWFQGNVADRNGQYGIASTIASREALSASTRATMPPSTIAASRSA